MNEMGVWRGAKILQRLFQSLFALLFASLLLALLFFNYSSIEVKTGPQLLAAGAVLLLVAAMVAIVWFAIKVAMIRRLFQKPWLVFLLVMVPLLVLQFNMVEKIFTPIGWDVGFLVHIAVTSDATWLGDYLSHYPNNHFLLLFIRAMMMVFTKLGVKDVWYGLSLIGAVAVDVAFLLVFAAVNKAFGKLAAYATLLFSVLLVGLSPWLIVPYSDIYSMPFVAAVFCFYVFWSKETARRKRIIYAVAGGLALGVGVLVKAHTIIVFIAITIVMYLFVNKKVLFGNLLFTGVHLALLLAVYVGLQIILANQNMITIKENRSYPLVHFMNMGVTYEEGGAHGLWGGFSGVEGGAIGDLDTTEEMRAVSAARYKEKMQAMGAGGYLRFLWNKARWITSEGYFFWPLEGNFAEWNLREPSVWSQWYYPTGQHFNSYIYLAQGVWAVTLLFVVVSGAFQVFARRDKVTMVLQLAVFGLLCFLLLFEGRSRYLISHLPLFAALAGTGLAAALRHWPQTLPQTRKKHLQS